MKKFLAILLVAVTVLSLCACGNKQNVSGGMTEDGKVLLSIGLPASATVIDHKNNALTKWIEDECNVELKFIEYSGGTDIGTQITTSIAARQELPDMLLGMSLDSAVMYQYGNEGYFVNLKDYFADKEGKSKIFWDRLEAEKVDEETMELLLGTITEPESGNIYAVPTLEISTFDRQQYQVYINTQWLDTLNLDMPTDIDSLYNVLKAFKTGDPNGNGQPDEIPLFGAKNGGMCSYVIEWLINMFMYFNDNRAYTVNPDGKLTASYTEDTYREALKFINKLYKEELLTALAWTASKPEATTIMTPASGTAMCGIMLCHPSSQPQKGNNVLFQYEPLPYWGCVVRDDHPVHTTAFITEDCDYPEKAFEVMMKLWSREGAMRMRYGEYGVNWTDPTPGAISAVGLPCTYKLIQDPLGRQNTCMWSTMSPTFNMYAEAEDAELAEAMTDWDKGRYELLAAHLKLFNEAEEKNNPEKVCPKLYFTSQENEEILQTRLNVNDYWRECQTDFIIGKLDPESDSDWNAYLARLKELGVDKVMEYNQRAYDRG